MFDAFAIVRAEADSFLYRGAAAEHRRVPLLIYIVCISGSGYVIYILNFNLNNLL